MSNSSSCSMKSTYKHSLCILSKEMIISNTIKARFTTGNYYSVKPGCVTNMVTQLGWDLLEHRRAKHRIAMFYKIINNLADIPVHHQLKVSDSSTRGSASHKFRQLNTKLNCNKYSFLPATIVFCGIPCRLNFVNYRDWNSFNMHYRKSLYHHLCIDDMGFLSIIIC